MARKRGEKEIDRERKIKRKRYIERGRETEIERENERVSAVSVSKKEKMRRV